MYFMETNMCSMFYIILYTEENKMRSIKQKAKQNKNE